MTQVPSSAITIIGSGLAAYNVARELRKLDQAVPLRILTRDAGDFYSKPMLSNGLTANKSAENLVMKSAAKMMEELGAEIHTHTSVTAIDPVAHRIQSSAGEFSYSKLVLALGADPIALPLQGDAAGAVLQVNDLDGYAKFRDALQAAQRVVVLGAGLIGCEFTNDLLGIGKQVSVLDMASWPLSRLLPEQAGRRLESKLSELGAQFYWGASAQAVEHDQGALKVVLSDGRSIAADIVLSAIGLRPRTQLAQAAGLTIGRGIVVDRALRTSNPDIYALGDCAEVAGLVLPFVMPIMNAARVLAPALLGQDVCLSYPAMPVLVKTPACPTLVSPPAMGVEGEWQVAEDEAALRASFLAADGQILGFALMGAATSERMAYTAKVPAVLA